MTHNIIVVTVNYRYERHLLYVVTKWSVSTRWTSFSMAGLVRQASSHWEWKRRRAMQDFGTSQQLYNGCKTTSLPLEAMLEGYKSSSSPLLVLLILFVITVFLRRLRTFPKLRDKQYIVPESRIGDLNALAACK